MLRARRISLGSFLRRCYHDRKLVAPLYEDRGDPCFLSDIQYALERLCKGGNAFALTWRFVRERTADYRLLLGASVPLLDSGQGWQNDLLV